MVLINSSCNSIIVLKPSTIFLPYSPNCFCFSNQGIVWIAKSLLRVVILAMSKSPAHQASLNFVFVLKLLIAALMPSTSLMYFTIPGSLTSSGNFTRSMTSVVSPVIGKESNWSKNLSDIFPWVLINSNCNFITFSNPLIISLPYSPNFCCCCDSLNQGIVFWESSSFTWINFSLFSPPAKYALGNTVLLLNDSIDLLIISTSCLYLW